MASDAYSSAPHVTARDWDYTRRLFRNHHNGCDGFRVVAMHGRQRAHAVVVIRAVGISAEHMVEVHKPCSVQFLLAINGHFRKQARESRRFAHLRPGHRKVVRFYGRRRSLLRVQGFIRVILWYLWLNIHKIIQVSVLIGFCRQGRAVPTTYESAARAISLRSRRNQLMTRSRPPIAKTETNRETNVLPITINDKLVLVIPQRKRKHGRKLSP